MDDDLDEMLDEAKDPRERLVCFASQTYKLLDEVCAHQKDSKGRRLFKGILSKDIIDAWKECRAQFALPQLKKSIRRIAIDSLAKLGLNGKQLNLKLKVIGLFTEAWQKYGGRKLLEKLFAAIDTVLDSLFELIGAYHALKEIKEILCSMINLNLSEEGDSKIATSIGNPVYRNLDVGIPR